MSEPGWTHLEASESDHDSEHDSQAEAGRVDYGVDAVEAASHSSPPQDEVDTGEIEEAAAAGPSAGSRAMALLSGVGAGASFALKGLGRMSPRTRIAVASGLSVLALAGGLASRYRGTGKAAPVAQINPPPAQDGEAKKPETAAVDDPGKKKDADKGGKEIVAGGTSSPDTSGASEKSGGPGSAAPADPLADKPPPPIGVSDTDTILAAANPNAKAKGEPDSKAKDDLKAKDDVDLPLPKATIPDTAPVATNEPPLPAVPTAAAGPGDSPALKSAAPAEAAGNAPLPDPAPIASLPPAGGAIAPLTAVAAGASAAAGASLAAIADDKGKPAAPGPSQPQSPLAANSPLGGLTPVDKPATPSQTDPSALPGMDPAAAPSNAPAASPVIPVPDKLPEPAAPLSGKTPEPKLDEPGFSPPAPSPTSPPAQPSNPLGEAPGGGEKPRIEIPAAPPQELPRAAVEVGAGAIAGAAAAAILSHDKDTPNPPAGEKEKAERPGSANSDFIPIRNSRSSHPRDLNSVDDPRGDDAPALFDSGADTSAVAPSSPIPDEAGDKKRQFEVEAPVPKTKGRVAPIEVDPKADRVEVTYHRVEDLENFWTISRLYYGSGRYFVALWSANRKAVPDMKELRVGQVIVIPAQEDLDPSLIQPAQAQVASTTAPKKPKAAALKGDVPAKPGAAAAPPHKSLKASGIDPIADEDDDDFASRAKSAGRSRPREREIDDGLDRVSDTGSGSTSDRDVDLPVHKVRPRETLRSIARDRLGDSRRAKEILQLNRGLIDDPASLVTGQVLELPEDAKPSRR